MKSFLLSTCCLLIFSFTSFSFCAEEERTWIDITGAHRMKGTFISCVNDKVTLKLSSGKEFEIQLNKLSSVDQQYVKNALAKQKEEDNPFKEKPSDNPFKMKDNPSDSSSSSTKTTENPPKAKENRPISDALLSIDKKILKADPLSAKSVNPLVEDLWEVELEQPEEITKKISNSISLPDKRNFHEKQNGYAFNPRSGKLAMSYEWSFTNKSPDTVISLVDLKNGKPNGFAVEKGTFSVLALHENGKQVLVCEQVERGFEQPQIVQLWTLTSKGIETDIDWRPCADSNGKNIGIKKAVFLNAEELAIQDEDGNIIIWNIPESTPTLGMKSKKDCLMAQSISGKYLGFLYDKILFLYDTDRRELVARYQSDIDDAKFIDFSPSGKKVGIFGNSKSVILDMSNGQPLHELEKVHGNYVSFIDDDYLLINRNQLYSIQNKLHVWTYSGADGASPSVFGKTWFPVAGNKDSRSLVPLTIPHKEAIQTMEKTLNDSSFRIMGPGSHVNIDLSGLPDQSKVNEILDAYAVQLDKNKITIDKGANLTIKVTVTGPTQRKQRFKSFHDHFGEGTEVTYNSYSVSTTIEQGGNVYWRTGYSTGPGFILHMNQGETIEQAVRRTEAINYDSIKAISFPKYVTKTSLNSNTLGTSSITSSGITTR